MTHLPYTKSRLYLADISYIRSPAPPVPSLTVQSGHIMEISNEGDSNVGKLADAYMYMYISVHILYIYVHVLYIYVHVMYISVHVLYISVHDCTYLYMYCILKIFL